MKWTKKKPNHEGWWWYKGKFSEKISVMKVTIGMITSYENSQTGNIEALINQFNGYWSDSPIEKPEGDKQ